MDPDARTIAITGATGFLGRHVVPRLLQEPDLRLRCLVRASSDTDELENLGGRVSLVRGDVSKPDALGPLFDGVWGVVNLAGYRDFWSRSRELYYALNTRGAENVFRAALDSGVEIVVQVSTPLAFGVPEEIPFNEESEAGPHPSDYARSKYLGDKIGWRLHREQGLPLTVVHLAAVIGADVRVPKLNLPESVLIPVARVLEMLGTLTGRRPAIPVDILKTTAAGSLIFDGTRAERELGLRYTPLRVALGEAIAEIREHTICP